MGEKVGPGVDVGYDVVGRLGGEKGEEGQVRGVRWREEWGGGGEVGGLGGCGRLWWRVE